MYYRCGSLRSPCGLTGAPILYAPEQGFLNKPTLLYLHISINTYPRMNNTNFWNLRCGHFQVTLIVILVGMIVLPLDYELYIGLNTLISASFVYVAFWESKSGYSEDDGGLWMTIAILLACWFFPAWDGRDRGLWIVSDIAAIVAVFRHRKARKENTN